MLFIDLNDGSCQKSLQIVVKQDMENFQDLQNEGVSSCLEVTGKFIQSDKCQIELEADKIKILGNSKKQFPGNYPLSKQFHTLETLRDYQYFRMRTNYISSIQRIRNSLAFSTHQFFQNLNFLYINTPILTCSDCEGAGETFQVSQLLKYPYEKIPRKDNKITYNKDFFGLPTFLTVSGQLYLETVVCGLGNGYTFGPCFRAENSNTSRHLSEFWMIEPEIAFADIHDTMQLAQDFIHYVVKYVLENNKLDLTYLNQWFEQQAKKNKQQKEPFNIIQYLESLIKDFYRIEYRDAIVLIQEAVKNGQKFQNQVEFGTDLNSEHETYLVQLFNSPIFVYNYPASCKAFYMKQNEDKETVAAFDCLIPHIGELIGGSQREENYDVLIEKIKNSGLNPDDYKYYTEIRKFGTCIHSGFGVGFERLVMMCTGCENIRDVIPFPKAPKNPGI